jgi:uncharacterized protein (DUF2267 family)
MNDRYLNPVHICFKHAVVWVTRVQEQGPTSNTTQPNTHFIRKGPARVAYKVHCVHRQDVHEAQDAKVAATKREVRLASIERITIESLPANLSQKQIFPFFFGILLKGPFSS